MTDPKRKKDEDKPKPRIIDFGFNYPVDAIAAFYWAWRSSDFKLTVTGNWLTEDKLWWQDVFEYDALMREAESDAEALYKAGVPALEDEDILEVEF